MIGVDFSPANCAEVATFATLVHRREREDAILLQEQWGVAFAEYRHTEDPLESVERRDVAAWPRTESRPLPFMVALPLCS